MKLYKTFSLALAACLAAMGTALAQPAAPAAPKPATAATKAANQLVQQTLPFGDKADFEDAQRGFIAAEPTLTIKGDRAGSVAWDLESFKQFIALDKPAPDSVNPSL